jgi:pilus assembly protein Flp/PilA
MNRFSKTLIRFLLDEEGPTAVEYAMLVMLVFLGCLTAITAIGQITAGSFEESCNSINRAIESRS